MPNPSTMISDAEAQAQYHFACAGAHNLRLSKASREIHLRNARDLADEHGFPQPEPINGRPAKFELVAQRFADNEARWTQQGQTKTLTYEQLVATRDALRGLTLAEAGLIAFTLDKDGSPDALALLKKLGTLFT